MGQVNIIHDIQKWVFMWANVCYTYHSGMIIGNSCMRIEKE